MKKFQLALLFLWIGVFADAKIYDEFTFFNELELLAIRLEELDPVIDHFVLVEGTQTFTGEKKPLFFLENQHLFEPYLHKIIHVVVDDFPYIDPKLPLKKQPWIREEHQRNAILRGLTQANAEDMVMITDVDEIPRREAIISAQTWLKKRSLYEIVSFEMSLFRYHLNRFDPQISPWKLGIATKCGSLLRIAPHAMRISYRWSHTIPDGGWHFTSQGGIDRVIEKYNNFSHAYDQDYNDEKKHVRYEFNQLISQYPIVPIDDTWPLRVRCHLSEYEAMGWIAK
jgi:hypothetical protein